MSGAATIVRNYVNLLIMEYAGLPKAEEHVRATVAPLLGPQTSIQEIRLTSVPTTGILTLDYGGEEAALDWDDDASEIEAKLTALTGLEDVTVSGTLFEKHLIISMVGVTPPARLLTIVSNTLDVYKTTIIDIDEILPVAVQNAFNMAGNKLAVGAQLDILAKYAGVTRTGYWNGEFIQLDDNDFFQLIKMASYVNTMDSSLKSIHIFLKNFFGIQIIVSDFQNMTLNYMIDQNLGSLDMVKMAVLQGLLPSPMGVDTSAILYVPGTNGMFSFSTYENPDPFVGAVGWNDVNDYDMETFWLSYHDTF